MSSNSKKCRLHCMSEELPMLVAHVKPKTTRVCRTTSIKFITCGFALQPVDKNEYPLANTRNPA